jgi:hypothetical protein
MAKRKRRAFTTKFRAQAVRCRIRSETWLAGWPWGRVNSVAMVNGKSGYWNVWWTLAVISAAIGVLAVVLEYLGIIRDLGTIIAIVSTALTALFGLTAPTRNSVWLVGGAVTELRGDIQPMARSLQRIETILDQRLPRG